MEQLQQHLEAKSIAEGFASDFECNNIGMDLHRARLESLSFDCELQVPAQETTDPKEVQEVDSDLPLSWY